MNIEKVVDRAYYWVDEKAKRTSLLFARKLSRRHFLSRIGVMVAGATAFPLLPVSRSFAQNSVSEIGDPQSCDYWRYCAMSGTLCTCCGGTYTSCPPGSEASPITWVGTCRNPVDGLDYLMSTTTVAENQYVLVVDVITQREIDQFISTATVTPFYGVLAQKIPAITVRFR